ncbi:hypothetical protein COCMIDRAFT_34971 [Bipolaris oryzae ATCC 44560]|uniref:Enoyl reductase (ER) domain-containing protein n=1 Tax=Bipolaris oryzae ATCC 44560 TaxID=930090 RepID=W6ZUI4_COCMI|nr:uncharacterized protein COCMIDRAFT_34971 [Bipolaris oryzae ATCC 44560]EUC47436.1 hypothetical protein COCMIDRAFT_34971 [Bipolaris oryzae ATCC 44560]
MSFYKSVHLVERPTDHVVPDQIFAFKTHRIPESINDGEILLQILYLSVDPAMRRWMDGSNYSAPPLIELGGVMRGSGIGIVTASKSSNFPVGSYASGMCGWTEYALMREKDVDALDLPKGVRLTDHLGVLGLTSLTAYFGILDIGNVKKGDFVVVSGAAGAVGSVVGQIAKIHGATVLGLAGSGEKAQLMKKELGFDFALNYKDADFAQKFTDTTKDLVDVYFDNVGGEILDLALSRAKPHSRFVMCGATSEYNRAKPKGLINYPMIIAKRITMQGFTVLDYPDRFQEAKEQLAEWLLQGKLKRKETIIKGGLGNAPQALLDLFDGKNTGKTMIEVQELEG